MSDMTPENAQKLREKFPASAIGKLPKGGVMLDFVGHATVTDRLLTVDPHWNWEPMGVDDHGLPAIDAAGNLWIKLTVCGVTRLGVGDGKNMKERIGDAIRNAAMRFGVALDLWSKTELESSQDQQPERRPEQTPPDPLTLAKTRVWELTKDRGDDEARKAWIAGALEARGTTMADATVEQLTAMADEWVQASAEAS